MHINKDILLHIPLVVEPKVSFQCLLSPIKKSTEKPFSCSFCHKYFSKKITMQIHERIHTGEKPYSCDSCDKKFVRSFELTRHKRLHSGEKPYSCKYCKNRFRLQHECAVHERQDFLTSLMKIYIWKVWYPVTWKYPINIF